MAGGSSAVTLRRRAWSTGGLFGRNMIGGPSRSSGHITHPPAWQHLTTSTPDPMSPNHLIGFAAAATVALLAACAGQQRQTTATASTPAPEKVNIVKGEEPATSELALLMREMVVFADSTRLRVAQGRDLLPFPEQFLRLLPMRGNIIWRHSTRHPNLNGLEFSTPWSRLVPDATPPCAPVLW